MTSILKMIEQDSQEYLKEWNFQEKKVFSEQERKQQLKITLEKLYTKSISNLKDDHNNSIEVLKAYSETLIKPMEILPPTPFEAVETIVTGKTTLKRQRERAIKLLSMGFLGYAQKNGQYSFSNKYLTSCISTKLNKKQRGKICKEIREYLLNHGYIIKSDITKSYRSMNRQEELKTIGCDSYHIMMKKYRKDRNNTPIVLNNKSWKLRKHTKIIKGFQIV